MPHAGHTVRSSGLQLITSTVESEKYSLLHYNATHAKSVCDTVELIYRTEEEKRFLMALVKWETNHGKIGIPWKSFMKMCEDVTDLVHKEIAERGKNKSNTVYI